MSLSCFGAAKGIWIASSQAAGVLSTLWKDACALWRYLLPKVFTALSEQL